MSRTRWLWSFMIVAGLFVAASCGDDDDGASTAPSGGDVSSDSGEQDATGDDSGPDQPPAASGAGGKGFVTIGGETIELVSGGCYLEEQPAAGGGGTIELTAQARGTDAAGEGVVVDFTRWGEDTMFTGDDVIVDIGDPFGDDLITYKADLDLGAVSVDGAAVSASDITFRHSEDMSEVTGSFEIRC